MKKQTKQIEIIEKASKDHFLARNEIIAILKDDSCDEFLFKKSDEVRKRYVGDEIHLRGLIEFSSICKQSCAYCGLRKENKEIQRYRLSKEEIIESAKKASQTGFKTIVLQSGEDAYFNTEKICEIISEIKKLKVAITLGVGEKSKEEYETYKKAGADRFLLRIETTDKTLYEKLHPHMDYTNRVKCLHNLKEIGFETGTGCLIGLPAQTVESLADDILFFKELNADMVGLGPFLPCENTPLSKEEKGNFKLALKVMAVTRLLLPDINIPATTAMETIHPNGRFIALQSGANVIMPNVNLSEQRKLYSIYPDKAGINAQVKDEFLEIEEKLKTIGRTISKEKGFRHRP